MKPLHFIAFLLLRLCGFGQESDGNFNLSIGEVVELESKILGEKREIYIYQPKGYWGMDVMSENLPVIYVLDGESQFHHTVATVEFLSAAPLGNDRMPRSIVVGIPNTNRMRDLSPIKAVMGNDSTTLNSTGGGSQFLDFITKELIPFVDSSYQSSAHRTMIGHSLGGLLCFQALLEKRTFFDNYIAIDPGFGFGDGEFMNSVIDTLNAAELSNKQFYFAHANTRPSFITEAQLLHDTSDILLLADIPNKIFIDHKDRQKWSLNLIAKHYPEENHFSLPLKATYDALKNLYAYYTFPEIIDYYHPQYKSRYDLIEKLKNHYVSISDKMGYEIQPMEGYLNSFAYGIAQSGRVDLAIDLFQYNIEIHPNTPILYNNLGHFYRSLDENEKAIEIFKKSLNIKNDEKIRNLLNLLELK